MSTLWARKLGKIGSELISHVGILGLHLWCKKM